MWSVEGRSEGNWEEKRLFYSEYLTRQYIHLRSRNRGKDRACGAWKGGARGRRPSARGLRGDYGETMWQVKKDNCDGLEDVWLEKMREGGAEGIGR